MDDLVKREGICYEKFTDAPFKGKVTGSEQGSIKNGVIDGVWVNYWDNGQLWHNAIAGKQGDAEWAKEAVSRLWSDETLGCKTRLKVDYPD